MAGIGDMTTAALYWLLVKATLFSFSGFGSLPQLREDLVIRHGVLTDEQLNRSVLVARTTPGPMGVYVVSVGYEVRGCRGAVAGWAALATPALLVLPLLFVAGRLASHQRAFGVLNALILASAVLLILSSWPLALDFMRNLKQLTG